MRNPYDYEGENSLLVTGKATKEYLVGIVAGRDSLRIDNPCKILAITCGDLAHATDFLRKIVHHMPNEDKTLSSEEYVVNMPLAALKLTEDGDIRRVSKLITGILPPFEKGWVEFRLNDPMLDRVLLIHILEAI